MYTDPIADMLTRIRNAVAIAARQVDIPASNFKQALAEVLVREGYLKSVDEAEVDGRPVLRIGLKYGPKRAPVIHSIQRISTPGRRAYARAKHVPVVRGGLGVAILSTSLGLMVDRDARRKHIGGEIICEVW